MSQNNNVAPTTASTHRTTVRLLCGSCGCDSRHGILVSVGHTSWFTIKEAVLTDNTYAVRSVGVGVVAISTDTDVWVFPFAESWRSEWICKGLW